MSRPDALFITAGHSESIVFTLPVAEYAIVITGLVGIRTNGVIEYYEGYTPDAAAKQFWEAMSGYIDPLVKSQAAEIERLRFEREAKDLVMKACQSALVACNEELALLRAALDERSDSA